MAGGSPDGSDGLFKMPLLGTASRGARVPRGAGSHCRMALWAVKHQRQMIPRDLRESRTRVQTRQEQGWLCPLLSLGVNCPRREG